MASCLPVGRADVPRSSDVSAGRSWSREVKEGEGEYSFVEYACPCIISLANLNS